MTSDELWAAVIAAPTCAEREARSVDYIDMVLGLDREPVNA